MRLFAAVQVVHFHAQFHLRPETGWWEEALRRVIGSLPGVPIFFVISGFLVSYSFERSDSLRAYAGKRAVRIFPALWVCLAITMVLLAATGNLLPVLLTPTFAVWLLAQATVGQFLHLDLFTSFGVGIPNGSLWTIPVELGFYVTLPLLYVGLVRRTTRRVANAGLFSICALSFTATVILTNFDPDTVRTSSKLLLETPIPHLYLFVLGMLAQRNYGEIERFVRGRFLLWGIAYYTVTALQPTSTCRVALGWCPRVDTSASVGLFLVTQVVLVGLVLSAAFSAGSLSERLLRRNDVSYGTYLFHMLIVNLLVEWGFRGEAWVLPVVLAAALGMGWLSWTLVERPALRLKSRFGGGVRTRAPAAVPTASEAD